MADSKALTAEYLRQVLDYDPDTGRFVWRKREVDMFKSGQLSASHSCKIFNGKFAGREAGVAMSHGYRAIRIADRLYLAHRLAWLHVYGEMPDCDIDHINMDGQDNRMANLRLATRSQNMANIKAHKDSKYGVKGVSKDKSGKWASRIFVRGKGVSLGVFDTPEQASAAYQQAAARLFGDFARAQ